MGRPRAKESGRHAIVRYDNEQATAKRIQFVMERLGFEMRMVRDRVIEEMRKRTGPICVSCLSKAVRTEFLAVLEVSHDAACALAFERRHGVCPHCDGQQQLLLNPVITR